MNTEFIKNKIFQHNSNLLVGWTFSFTSEEARVDDLAKACAEIKFILIVDVSLSVYNIVGRLFSLRTEQDLTLWTSFHQFPTWLIHVWRNVRLHNFIHLEGVSENIIL